MHHWQNFVEIEPHSKDAYPYKDRELRLTNRKTLRGELGFIIIITIFILIWCKIVKILIKTNHPLDTTIVSMLLSAQKKM